MGGGECKPIFLAEAVYLWDVGDLWNCFFFFFFQDLVLVSALLVVFLLLSILKLCQHVNTRARTARPSLYCRVKCNTIA